MALAAFKNNVSVMYGSRLSYTNLLFVESQDYFSVK